MLKRILQQYRDMVDNIKNSNYDGYCKKILDSYFVN